MPVTRGDSLRQTQVWRMYMKHEKTKKHYGILGWMICVLASLFYCYEYVLRIEPSVMMSSLQHHFNISSSGYGYISTAYLVGYTPLQLFVGPIIDHYGSRVVLLFALSCCICGSFLFGFADHLAVAVAGRFLIGVGSAFAFVGVLRLAATWLHAKYFAFFVGLSTALAMVGAMMGDLGMSYMVDQYGWQKVIFNLAYFGCLLLPLFLLFIRDANTVKKQEADPLFFKKTLEVFANTRVLAVGLIGCVLYLSLSVFADIWGMGFAQALLNTSNVNASSINSMVYVGWLVGAPLMGWFAEIWLAKTQMVLMGTFLAGLVFTLILLLPIHSVLLLKMMLFAFGLFSSVEVLCFAIGKESVAEAQIATALGVINFIVMLGGMIILPLVGRFLDISWSGVSSNHIRVYSAGSYKFALAILPLLFLVAFIVGLYVKKNDHGEFS